MVNQEILGSKDNLIDLPTFDDFIKNNESLKDIAKLKLDYLDAIDKTNFKDLLSSLKRVKNKMQTTSNIQDLIV